MKLYILMLFFSFLFSVSDAQILRYKFNHSGFESLNKIPEPSDIVFDKETKLFFIVSDHGKLFECDSNMHIVRKAKAEGLDFEGIEIVDSFIYVSDETPRKVYKYRKSDLSLVATYTVSWGGAANKAFESICYNYRKNCFILVSQQPVTVVEYTTDFKEIGRYKFNGARNIAGARWHNGELYLLSSLDAAIIKCDPLNYLPISYYNINVLNPEGIAFDEDNNVFIVSDDLQRIYYFNKLPTTN